MAMSGVLSVVNVYLLFFSVIKAFGPSGISR